MFTFASPYAFLLILPMAAGAFFVYRKGIRTGVLFAATSRLPAHSSTWRGVISRLASILFLIGLLLAIVALARPRTVLSKTKRTSDAIAIEMLVDVSGSMEAIDLSDRNGNRFTKIRTRLDAVKSAFKEFVDERPDDLIGIVTFGGYATTRAPLTLDHDALKHVLEGVSIPKPVNGQPLDEDELNTAIGDALASGYARLQDVKPKSKIIVLLSDGASNTGIIKPEEALQAARKLGIKIYTIGIGTVGGNVPVMMRDAFNRPAIGMAQYEFDEDFLKRAAETTGGEYYNVQNVNGLKQAMESINKLERTEIEKDVYYRYNELFLWFLIPSLILIVMATGLNMCFARRII